MSRRSALGAIGLLGLLLLVSAGNLLATYRIVQDSRHQRSAQVCSTLGRIAAQPDNSQDTARLVNGFGTVYGCDWSQP